MINLQTLSGADFAFIGDAYYELEIRHYLIKKGITSLHKLHDECVKYVSRTAQHQIINKLFSSLTLEEQEIFRRGRNFHYKIRTNDYINASGFEAVIGYLYLNQRIGRLKNIIYEAIKIIEDNNE